MSHVTHVNCVNNAKATLQKSVTWAAVPSRKSHGTHMNESCRTCESWRQYKHYFANKAISILSPFVRSVPWLIQALHDSFMCVKRYLYCGTHMNESCNTSYEWVMSHIHVNHDAKAEAISQNSVTYVVAHIRMSHGTLMSGSSHMWIHRLFTCHPHVMSHFTRADVILSGNPTVEFKLMIHIAHINESCYTYEWVMSRMWIHMLFPCHVNNAYS